MIKGLLTTGVLLWILGLASDASAQRVALVIGNASYRSLAPLRNTVSDARAIEGSLKNAGFAVTTVLTLTSVP